MQRSTSGPRRDSHVLAALDAVQITRWRRYRPSEDAQSAREPAPGQPAPGRRRHPPRRGRHSLVGILATGALVATLAPSAVAGGPDPSGSGTSSVTSRAGESYGNLWNILPPGSHGNVTALDLAALG